MTFICRGGLLLVVALAGCASPDTERALDGARQAVGEMAANPLSGRTAPRDLQRAEETLAQAERLAGYWGGAEDARHYAYLSQRYAQIAEANNALAGHRELIQRLERRQDRLQFAVKEVESRSQQLGQSLEAQLISLAAEETDRGLVMTLGDVLFQTGSAELGPSASRTLTRLAQFLQMNPRRRVRIEGYTDAQGKADNNLALSRARAQSVADLLVDLGIEPSRLEVLGYGEAHPVAENASSRGRARNRRVEILFSDAEGTLGPAR